MTMEEKRGRISLNPRGFGFFSALDGIATAAFVAPPLLNTFLDGDIVSATLTTDASGRVSASELTLVERPRKQVFGTVTLRGKRLHLAIDRAIANTDWPFQKGGAKDLQEGDAVVAAPGDGAVSLVRRLPKGADLDIASCLVRHGLALEQEEPLLDAAQKAAEAQRAAPGVRRRDLSDLCTVTIDGPSTTDIDDALAVIPAGADGALRVLVSIADVDAFVPEGSLLDEDARARGTSVYLAGKHVPMLPASLSSDAASLMEGVRRPALTVEMRIDAEGEVTSVDLYESTIRSHARLTYSAVSAFFQGDAQAVSAEVAPTLRWLRAAGARIGAVRAARGGVEIASEEAYLSMDAATGEPTGVAPVPQGASEKLVERLMVAANEAVARWLVERGLPGVFRVHEPPTPERVTRLGAIAQSFGIEAGFGPTLSPRALLAFDAQVSDSRYAQALHTALGKALGSARYSAAPGLHFGLASPLYLHFTSPIRRYSDLAVHRIVKRYLAGDRSMSAQRPDLTHLAEHLSEKAKASDKAEKERRRMLVARLFASKVGEEFKGHVFAVKAFGLVVWLDEPGVTGTCAIDALPGGPFEADLLREVMKGPARTYHVGDPLRVRVTGTNERLGRIELAVG